MHIENLNSQQTVSAAEEKRLQQRIDFLLDCFWRTPFYLVDPVTIDLLYPPEKRHILNEECVREVLESQRGEAEEEHRGDPLEAAERLLGQVAECRRERGAGEVMIAVGVYLPELLPAQAERIRETTGRELPSLPSIFVCPERVDEWVDKAAGRSLPPRRRGEARRLLFEAIALHELTHAFAGPGRSRRQSEAQRIIEESLANAVAFSHFEPDERPWVSRCFARQPMEYRGYPFWTLQGEREVRRIVANWRLKRSVFWPFAFWGTRGAFHFWIEYEHWLYEASGNPKYEARLALDLLATAA